MLDNALIPGGVERLYENKSMTLIIGILIFLIISFTNTVMRVNIKLNDYSFNSLEMFSEYDITDYDEALELEEEIFNKTWDE